MVAQKIIYNSKCEIFTKMALFSGKILKNGLRFDPEFFLIESILEILYKNHSELGVNFSYIRHYGIVFPSKCDISNKSAIF